MKAKTNAASTPAVPRLVTRNSRREKRCPMHGSLFQVVVDTLKRHLPSGRPCAFICNGQCWGLYCRPIGLAGANKVIIEAREGGKDLGIYNGNGNVKEEDVQVLEDNLDVAKLIWEAPQKNQQTYLILKFGSNVNLGNISPDEITALETMRRGLRGDTLGKVNL